MSRAEGTGPAHGIAGVCTLDADDVPVIDALRGRALATLPHRDCYIPHENEPAFVQAHLGDAGLSFGLAVNAAPVGYTSLSLDPARACLDRELTDRIALWCAAPHRHPEDCCVLAITMILREYRGLGLHKAAIDLRMDHARACGKAYVCAMVSPHNGASLHNLLARGLQIEDTLVCADGRVRHFLTGSIASRADETRSAGRPSIRRAG